MTNHDEKTMVYLHILFGKELEKIDHKTGTRKELAKQDSIAQSLVKIREGIEDYFQAAYNKNVKSTGFYDGLRRDF